MIRTFFFLHLRIATRMHLALPFLHDSFREIGDVLRSVTAKFAHCDAYLCLLHTISQTNALKLSTA